jgi:chromosome segregation ATPase
VNAIETQSGIQRAIGDLQTLKEQWSGVESIDKERDKAQAKLDAVKQNVAAMRGEFNEVKHAHAQILTKAREDQAKLQGLQGEIKRKSAELTKINAEFDKLRQLLREFEALDPGFQKLAVLMNETKSAVNSVRVKLGA